MATWTDAKKIEVIGYIIDRQSSEQNDEDGDKYRSDANLAVEAIEAVLAGDQGRNGSLRMYLASE